MLVSSFKEGRAKKLAITQSKDWLAHNTKYLSRVYPGAARQGQIPAQPPPSKPQPLPWHLHDAMTLTDVDGTLTMPPIAIGLAADSSNIPAQLLCELWDCGIQMVALNYQTPSKAMAVNEALFTLNRRCGYGIRRFRINVSTFGGRLQLRPSSPPELWSYI